jgi:Na+/proline symporter
VDATLTLTDPSVLLAGVVGGMFLTFGSHGVDQLMVQRYLCARSQAEAGRALTWSGVVVLLQFAFFLLIGVGLYAFYEAFPPAVPFDRPDRVFARFILEQLPPGLLGLVLGAVFAAAMSTLSSSLNSSATAVVNDFYRPLFDPDGSSERTVAVTRCLTVVFGVVQVAVALAGQALSRTVVESVLTIAGFTTGITLGVFLLAGARRRVGPRAAFFGMVVGIVAVSLAAFATPLAWPWYTLVGSLSTLIAGLTAGRLWPEDAG